MKRHAVPVVACACIALALAGIAVLLSAPSHHHDDALNDIYDEYDRAIDHGVVNMRALSHQLGRVQPEALRRKGVL